MTATRSAGLGHRERQQGVTQRRQILADFLKTWVPIVLSVAAVFITWQQYNTSQAESRARQASQVVAVPGGSLFDRGEPIRIQNYSRLPIDFLVVYLSLGVRHQASGELEVVERHYPLGLLEPCEEVSLGPLFEDAASDPETGQPRDYGQPIVRFTFADTSGATWQRVGFQRPVKDEAASWYAVEDETVFAPVGPIPNCVPG